MTQAPTPGPLSGDDVKLLVKGDLLRDPDGLSRFDFNQDDLVCAVDAKGTRMCFRPKHVAFIGRPDADGWVKCRFASVPDYLRGIQVEAKTYNDLIRPAQKAENVAWSNMIAFRLAPTAMDGDSTCSNSSCSSLSLSDGAGKSDAGSNPTAPVEASGTERDAFEKWYCDDAATLGIKMLPIETLALREGETYGPKRVALNSKWEAWQARAALRPQPSGETRDDDAQWLLDNYGAGHPRIQRIADRIRPAPVASGGQHSSGEGFHRNLLSHEDNEAWAALSTTPVAETAGEAVEGLYTFKLPGDLTMSDIIGHLVRRVAKAGDATNINVSTKFLRVLLNHVEATPPVPAQDDDKLRVAVEALGSVIKWGESRCPCYNDLPDPCPLCDASVANLEGCKSAEKTFPSKLLGEMRQALAALKSTAAQEGGAK